MYAISRHIAWMYTMDRDTMNKEGKSSQFQCISLPIDFFLSLLFVWVMQTIISNSRRIAFFFPIITLLGFAANKKKNKS